MYPNIWENWVWQEDNSPVRESKFAQHILLPQIPNKMWLTAKSQDLSPIANLGILQSKMKSLCLLLPSTNGRVFLMTFYTVYM